MYVLHVLQIETRGLPAGVVGPIRVMTIEGIDENMCCGTHVSNLSHLQVTMTCLSSLGYLISLNIYYINGKPFSLSGIDSETTQQTLTYDTPLEAV